MAKPGSGLATLTQGFTYESAFNKVATASWTYTYDLNNRLKSTNRTSPALAIKLSYDAEGRLRVVSPAGVATSRLYDGQDLVAEYNSASALTARHVHGQGTSTNGR